MVVTFFYQRFNLEICRKLPEKHVKTAPNTSLKPPSQNRKLLINQREKEVLFPPDFFQKISGKCLGTFPEKIKHKIRYI